MNIIRVETDHHEERRDGAVPSCIILHYTDTRTLAEAEDYFTGRRAHPEGGRVSAHYMIDFDGTVVQYVDEERRAWHAGASYWAGIRDINSHSIGIELVNPGRRYGYVRFPNAQMDVLAELCQGIMERYAISPWRVIGHSDVAPGRRFDPGEKFDWRRLAAAGCAIWPEPDAQDTERADMDKTFLRDLFSALGYDPEVPLIDVLDAFRQHFHPEYFDGNRDTAVMAARLRWLVREKPALIV